MKQGLIIFFLTAMTINVMAQKTITNDNQSRSTSSANKRNSN